MSNGIATIVTKARPQPVQEALEEICATRLPVGKWLDESNALGLGGDIENTSGCDIIQHMAASSILHCFDGWTYLGRAIQSMMSGDLANTVHLAYYAELRAALSIFANQGIGIYNSKGIAAEENNCVFRNRIPGTHKAAWQALEIWADKPSTGALIGTVIRPFGAELGDWIDSLVTHSTSERLGRDLILSWGLDIEVFAEDHDARNRSSYDPSIRLVPTEDLIHDQMIAVESFWSLSSPPLAALDNLLLAMMVHKIVFKEDDEEPDDAETMRKRLGSSIDTVLAIDESRKSEIRERIGNVKEMPGYSLLVHAQQKSNFCSKHYHLEIVARAFFLLRIATGICSKSLREAGYDGESSALWTNLICQERALHLEPTPISSVDDLWLDVDVALEDFIGEPEIGLRFAQWCRQPRHTDAAVTLSSCERIALWGMGL
jgi:hypothetical protein